jgi:hypothetical protein
MATETNPVLSGTEGGATGSVVSQALRNKGFVLCTVLLSVFTVGFFVVFGFIKPPLPLPLKTPLSELKQERLAPYKLLKPIEIQPDILNQLGTDQYLQWILQEPLPPGSREQGRAISLFVTYYTGQADAVPHIPDSCYVGSGHELVTQYDTTVTVTSKGREIVVPLQVLEFRKASQWSQNQRVVLYTFHSNGQFRKDRTEVRLAIGSLTNRYAYFSKIEVGLDLEPGRFSKEQAVEAAKGFLKVAIPVLLEDHWPDWDAATRIPASQPAVAKAR